MPGASTKDVSIKSPEEPHPDGRSKEAQNPAVQELPREAALRAPKTSNPEKLPGKQKLPCCLVGTQTQEPYS